jgi:hypothetical protein
MYAKIVDVAYDVAEQHPKYKGIMLYEAEKIIAVLKEYIFEKENNLESIKK